MRRELLMTMKIQSGEIILQNLRFHAFPRITSISLQLLKCNPPMGGDADGAGVAFTFVSEE